jgi:hypothetical protein
MVSGRLTTVTENRWVIALVGDPDWHNYAVEVDVDYPIWSDSDFRILARVQDANNMMGLHLEKSTSHSGSIDIRAKTGGEWKVIAKQRFQLGERLMGENPHLRFEVGDSIYTVYVDGEQWLSVSDSTFTSGRAGLELIRRKADKYAAFDRFVVLPLD